MSQIIKFHFTSSMLNIFRTLIHPSSGACDIYIVQTLGIQPVQTLDIQTVQTLAIQSVQTLDIQPVQTLNIQPVQTLGIQPVQTLDIHPTKFFTPEKGKITVRSKSP